MSAEWTRAWPYPDFTDPRDLRPTDTQLAAVTDAHEATDIRIVGSSFTTISGGLGSPVHSVLVDDVTASDTFRVWISRHMTGGLWDASCTCASATAPDLCRHCCFLLLHVACARHPPVFNERGFARDAALQRLVRCLSGRGGVGHSDTPPGQLVADPVSPRPLQRVPVELHPLERHPPLSDRQHAAMVDAQTAGDMTVVRRSFAPVGPDLYTVLVNDTGASDTYSVFMARSAVTWLWGISCTCANGQHPVDLCRHCCYLLVRVATFELPEAVFAAAGEGRSAAVCALVRFLSTQWSVPAVAGFSDPTGPPPPPPREDVGPADPTEECPVCYEAFSEQRCVLCNRCSRLFHRACAARWGRSCPLCRDDRQFADIAAEAPREVVQPPPLDPYVRYGFDNIEDDDTDDDDIEDDSEDSTIPPLEEEDSEDDDVIEDDDEIPPVEEEVDSEHRAGSLHETTTAVDPIYSHQNESSILFHLSPAFLQAHGRGF